MYIPFTLLGVSLLFFGLFCIKMSNDSEYTGVCILFGVLSILAGLILPVVVTINSFNEGYNFSAIASIVTFALSFVGLYFFAKWLW